jgi:lysyl oxidase
MPFCPSGLRERINGRGPEVSRYPPSCNSFSPFVRGLVWGIDRGWASGILDFGGPDPKVKIDNGHYRVTAAVAKPYRRVFGMSHHEATVHLRAYVHGRGGGSGGKRGPAEHGSPPPDVPKVSRVPRSQRPDLVALPAWNIQADRQGPHDLLTFSATEWNAGPAPLDVEGFRTPGHDRMRAFEYFRDRRGRVVGREPAGHLEFDRRRGHQHWHFEQFARYTLVRNRTHKVAASHKQSFCIAPTDLIDLTLPGADWMTEPASLTTACGSPTSLWVREAMPAGWGDTYSQIVAGQAFNITHVPNGVYVVRVQVNPRGLLSEVERGNDSVVRRVRLGGQRGHRTVHAAPWRGIDP